MTVVGVVLEEKDNHHQTSNHSWIRQKQDEENGTLPPPALQQFPLQTSRPPLVSSTTTTTTTTTSTTRKTIALHCLLNSRNTFCYVHFPHTLQALSQCWSYFQSQTHEILHELDHHPQQQDGDAVVVVPRITTAIHTHGIRGRFHSLNTDWRASLMQLIMTHVRYVNHAKPSTLPRQHQSNRTHETRIFRPKAGIEDLQFFWNYSHVQALHENLYQTELYRNQTLGGTVVSSNTTDDHSNQSADPLCIGLINRKTARRIVNMDQLERAIRQEYPQALVQVVTMEGMTPLQQYIWWNQQSIVVTPHGAATTNLIFMKPGSAVLELYQPHYYWWGFWKLAQTAQVRYYAQFPILLPNATARHHSSNHSHTHHTTTTTSQQQAAEVALFQDFVETCSDWPWQRQQQKLAVLEPSIPHVMVLLRRAVTDWQQQQTQTTSSTSAPPQPQIVRMETSCQRAQSFYQQHKNDNHLPEQIQTRVQLSLEEDPPQTLLDQYGG